MSASRVFGLAPSDTSEGGGRGGQGETGFAPPVADEANSVSCSGQKIKLSFARRRFFGYRKPEV